MKLRFATIAILILVMTSCKKSFLDLPSQTALTSGVYFKTQSDFQQAINAAYTPLRSIYAGSGGAYVMGEMRSDNTTYKYNSNDRGTVAPEYVKNFNEDANNSVLSQKWNNDYTIIARANQVLAPIDDVDFDNTVKNNIKGQAFFLRAFAYFDLAQYFGAVPLHVKPAGTLSETALPLTGVDSIYLQVIADATEAASLLPDKATQEAGRATSGAALTLLGNVYITQKNWALAESTLKQVTGYSLLSDYAGVFDPTNKNNAESVFEVQYKEGTEGLNSYFFYTFLVQPISAAEVSAVTGIPENDRTIEGFNIPTPDMIAAYEDGDLRKDASIGYITAGGVSYPYIKKYSHPHATTGNTNDNWPVYRYSEVLLFLAEALNEQNKTADALTYLNQVHASPRTGLSPVIVSSQADLRDAILQERRIELAFENKRWLDLVRSGTAVAVMTAYGAKVKANPQAYYFPPGIAPQPSSFNTINLLFPIPQSDASLNPYF